MPGLNSLLKICLFFGLLLFFFNCESSPNLRQRLAGTNRIEAIFYAENSTQPEDTIIITRKEDIKALNAGFSTAEAPAYKCGYHGRMTFFQQNVALLIGEFNLGKDCAHLSFMQAGKSNRRHISTTGVDLLQKARKYPKGLK
jgi:hypothetical protein